MGAVSKECFYNPRIKEIKHKTPDYIKKNLTKIKSIKQKAKRKQPGKGTHL